MRKLCTPIAVTAATLTLLALPAIAQDSGLELGGAQSKKVRFFGYFSQAYAATDGNQILGITDDGTSAYYNLALQLRYEPSARDTFVVQLARERQGRSPLEQFRDDLEIDWAFYEHRFSPGTYVKVGRVPIPTGIYNELRDVGTVLPFYFPPFSIYGEGAFSNESVDGLLVGHRFFAGSPWSLDVDVYGGRWESYETNNGEMLIGETNIDNALGTQLWLNTPVQGLRLGVGAQRYDVSDGIYRSAESDRWELAVLSLDGDFERLLVRAEASQRKSPIGLTVPPVTVPDFRTDSFYVQVGYRFDSGWSVFGQVEEGRISYDLGFIPPVDMSVWQDQALSLSYGFGPKIFSGTTQVVVKLELHHNEGFFVENPSFSIDPPETTYGILSASFAIF